MIFTEEQKMLREMVRDFALNRIKPEAAAIDEEERFPIEILSEMSDLGLMGIPFPEELGGAGMDTVSYILALEEISKVCASTALTLMVHTALAGGAIHLWGSEDQKQQYLPELCSGKTIGAFALSEPEAGSDLGATRTVCIDAGDHYLLNGVKTYCTNGSYAQVFIVTALSDETSGARGLSSYIVEKGWPGFEIGRKIHKLGVRGSDTVELRFVDVKVPKENLLGKEREGLKQMLSVINWGRLSIAAIGLGIAEGAYDSTVGYVKQRKMFGQTLADFQATQFKLSDMYTQIEAARHLIYEAAVKKDQGEAYDIAASVAKLFVGEMAPKICSQAIQLYGGYGYMRDYPVERMFRDSKLCEVGGGTAEMQRLAIARSILRENR
jgi:butyryl-CoA dehydrogenase